MTKKVLAIFLIVLVLIGNLNIIYATSYTSEPNPSIWDTATKWLRDGQNLSNGNDVWDYFSQLAGVLWGAGIFVILIWGSTLGIKYMFASVDDKADVKKGLTPLAIGSVIIIGALTIWQILVNVLEGVSY